MEIGGCHLGNCWVVPHNPLLTMLMDCHVNVEICTGMAVVKYIHKYVTKGGDRCLAELRQTEGAAIDEIKQYVDAR